MSFYRFNECLLTLYEGGKTTEIVFPEELYGVATFNQSRRYVAVSAQNKIFVYDFETEKIITLRHKSKYPLRHFRFDSSNRLYYLDGNQLGLLDINNGEDISLFDVGRKHHNPQDIGVSSDGRYVSFCRYRSDNCYLYLFDTQKEELIDYKLSLYHYAWLDDAHIVWSKGGGLKVLDVNTGKSQLLVKDHKTLIKKSKENAERFAMFHASDNASLYVDVYLLRISNGKIYFSLVINDFKSSTPEYQKKHYGIWSIYPKDYSIEFHYEFSSDCRKAGERFITNDGKLAWIENEWHIYDGVSEETFPGDWEQAIYFDSLNR